MNQSSQVARSAQVSMLQTGSLLQRKCACGTHTIGGSECEDCGKKRLQTKLKVNEPGDAYEQEADRVAQAMMGTFSHTAEPKSQAGGELDQPADSDLTRGGERLSPGVVEFYETRFGRDFSAVRVHTGESAKRYNDAVNAYAFTYGSHIWLGPGLRQQPSHILAHELAHVVQQTQPPPLASAHGQPGLSPASKAVQRAAPYWMPERYKVVGTESHAFILPEIGKKNGIFTEAPVPNANKVDVGYNRVGIADLYQAFTESPKSKKPKKSTTVGVFFINEKIPDELKSSIGLKFKGERYGHIENSAPQADKARISVIRAGSAPTRILVGDLKPSHGTFEADEGPEQVQKYLAGFKFAHNEVNKMEVGEGAFHQTDAEWPELTTGLISIKIPTMFQEPLASGQRVERLVLVHNGLRVNLPRTVVGKVYVRESPGGIWNYTWAPLTRLTADDLPQSVTGLSTELTARIIRPLLESPVQTAAKARPARPASSLTPSTHRIQALGRKAKPEKVKDPFDKAAFDRWVADHGRLTGKEKQLEKTPQFEEAKFKLLAAEDRRAANKSGFSVPPVSAKEEEAGKTLKKIQFWTGASSAFLGRLRYWFGGAFVKVYNAYHSIRDRFKKSLDGKNAPKSGGLLGTIIKIAFNILKVVGRILVERTAEQLVTSLITGVELKLKGLIPEERIEEFEAKVEEVRKLADRLEQQFKETVEELVERTIGPYEKYIGIIVEVANDVSKVADVVSKVRWGARVIACLSPPGWGCLWILAESVIEKFASWVIDRCWFKQEIAPLVTRVKFIADLPKDLARLIIGQINKVLPTELQGVLADVPIVDTKVPSNEICNENDRDVLPRDRFLLEKLALADLREKIGEEKWKAWTKLAELYGVTRGLPLTEQQVEQLQKELQKADLTALKEAADLFPSLSATTHSRDVVNLTTFLDRAEQVKQEMFGGGGKSGGGGTGESGSGGAGIGDGGEVGISVGPAKKPVEGSARPSPHGWQIVSGVKRGQFQGDVIKIDVAATIKGEVVTLRDIEVVIKDRVFLPNPSNPEKAVFHLEATKEQVHSIEEQYGAAVARKIGIAWHRYNKGHKFRPYTLQLKGGKAE